LWREMRTSDFGKAKAWVRSTEFGVRNEAGLSWGGLLKRLRREIEGTVVWKKCREIECFVELSVTLLSAWLCELVGEWGRI